MHDSLNDLYLPAILLQDHLPSSSSSVYLSKSMVAKTAETSSMDASSDQSGELSVSDLQIESTLIEIWRERPFHINDDK